jgi:glycosyltransferase involved in cell wall biosynthesis
MKVAYVHDWLVINGGAEKVARDILACYPQAEVFTLVDYLSEEDRRDILHGKHTTTSFIQKLPLSKTHYRNYLPLFPTAIEQFDLSDYDLVISSSYAVAKGVITHSSQTHICYCHSPVRYAWDQYDSYLKEHKVGKGPKGLLIRYFLHRLRKWDYKTANRVDHYIANSQNVANRIKNYYNREATVIYPPVDVEDFTLTEEKEPYYVTASRLVPYKKIQMMVEAFNELPHLEFRVLGTGPELENLQKLAKPNVKIMGFQQREEQINQVKKAKAFIVAAHEDLGITPVEAQSCGTPVIALKAGGYLETVVAGETGIFFQEQNVESLKSAIEEFERNGIHASPASIRAHTLQFSDQKFKDSFTAFVEEKHTKTVSNH